MKPIDLPLELYHPDFASLGNNCGGNISQHNMLNKINEAFHLALKNKDKRGLIALRGLKNLIDKYRKEKKTSDVPDLEVIAFIRKEIEQYKETQAGFIKAKNAYGGDEEQWKINTLRAFLPQTLSEDEVLTIIQDCLKETGATSKKEMGKVMALAKQKSKGAVDNAVLSKLIGDCLLTPPTSKIPAPASSSMPTGFPPTPEPGQHHFHGDVAN